MDAKRFIEYVSIACRNVQAGNTTPEMAAQAIKELVAQLTTE